MSNPFFADLMRQVRAKAPRAVAEMAHYHHLKDDLELEGDDLRKADACRTWVECVTPPPAHPSQAKSLCMEFRLEIGDAVQVVWLDDAGGLTKEPEKARVIHLAWTYDRALRDELRIAARTGIRTLRATAESLGVPLSFIRDNDR